MGLPAKPHLEAHPYAEIFPLDDGKPLWDLSDDIAKHGQHHPIVTFQGKILDGRRRHAACLRAGVDPKLKPFNGNEETALAYVISHNVHRRHLGVGDRSLIAARLATMTRGGNNGQDQSQIKGHFCPLVEDTKTPQLTQEQAASQLKVSETSLKQAKTVISETTASIQRAVKDGEVSLSDAVKIASETPQAQNLALKSVRSGEAKTLAAAVREPGDESEEMPANCDSHGRKKKKKRPAKPKPVRGKIRDNLGNVLPDHLRDAFVDKSLQELIQELESVEAFILPESWTKLAGKLTDHYGFILIEKFGDHATEAKRRIQLALEALRSGVPHALCPKCLGVNSRDNGKTCKGCRGYGHVPEHRLAELTKE